MKHILDTTAVITKNDETEGFRYQFGTTTLNVWRNSDGWWNIRDAQSGEWITNSRNNYREAETSIAFMYMRDLGLATFVIGCDTQAMIVRAAQLHGTATIYVGRENRYGKTELTPVIDIIRSDDGGWSGIEKLESGLPGEIFSLAFGNPVAFVIWHFDQTPKFPIEWEIRESIYYDHNRANIYVYGQDDQFHTDITIYFGVRRNWRDGTFKSEVEINWPAIGSVSPVDASRFATAMLRAAEVAGKLEAICNIEVDRRNANLVWNEEFQRWFTQEEVNARPNRS